MSDSDFEHDSDDQAGSEPDHRDSEPGSGITLINDGEGIAVVGESRAVERFVASLGVQAREMEMPRLSGLMAKTSGVTQAASQAAAESGRWIKLTEKSARDLAEHVPMKGSQPGVSRAIMTSNGRTKTILEFSTKPGAVLSNPAVLAGAAGLMAQLAMQSTMTEITDYLATIDAKVDEVLRAQKDAVVADLIGVGLVVDEAMTIREGVGGVSAVTWSKVQATGLTIARTQGYALASIDALATKLEAARQGGDMRGEAAELEAKVGEWLALLARCFQLQEAVGVLELDRVFADSPDELDAHRRSLQVARRQRRDHIEATTRAILSGLDAAVATANERVLLNPLDSRALVAAGQRVHAQVVEFHTSLGIDGDDESAEGRAWREAATEARDKALDSSKRGLSKAKLVGGGAASRLGSASRGLAGRVRRSEKAGDTPADDPAETDD